MPNAVNPNSTPEQLHEIMEGYLSSLVGKGGRRPKYTERDAMAVLEHPNVSSKTVDAAASWGDFDLHDRAIVHPKISIEHLIEQGRDFGKWSLGLSHSVHASKIIDFILSNKIPAEAKLEALASPHVTEEQLTNALRLPDRSLRYRAISNEKATPKHIDIALKDQISSIRGAAVGHRNATSAHVDLALSDKDPYVRRIAAASHSATPAQISRALRDRDSVVRTQAIKNPNATEEHIDLALRTGNENLAGQAAMHPKATSAHLDHAFGHKSSVVRTNAASNPSATVAHLDRALGDGSFLVRLQALSNPNVTPAHVERAQGDKNVHVRRDAARHPLATEASLHLALSDTSLDVRRDAISNPRATPAHIDRALQDANDGVRADAANHPNMSGENIDRVLGMDDRYSHNRIQAAGHPNATPANIDRALADRLGEVRLAAASNPAATDEQLERAKKDKDRYVRAAAESQIKERIPLEGQKGVEVVHVAHGTEKLRALRDYLEGQGGAVHKSKLPAAGVPDSVKRLLDSKGNLTAQAIQGAIDALPRTPFLVSHAKWTGMQRHSDEASRVFQVSATKEMIQKIREAKLYPFFKEYLELTGTHPRKDRVGLGWIRYTGTPKTGIHIDEIQTDLLHHGLEHIGDQLGQIAKICFGDKYPNNVFHDLFHEYMRQKHGPGVKIALLDSASKAPLVGMDHSKPLPKSFLESYRTNPQKLGYQEGQYGALRTQGNYELQGAKTWTHVLRKFEDNGNKMEMVIPMTKSESHDRDFLRDGLYRVMACKHGDDPHNPHRALAGVFSVEGHEIHHMEDHFGHLRESLPEGPVTHAHIRALAHLLASGYYELVHDDDLEGGHHPDLVPEMSMHYGAVPTYTVSGGDYSGKTIKVYGEQVFLNDGTVLTESQARRLLGEVESGEVNLEPQEDPANA